MIAHTDEAPGSMHHEALLGVKPDSLLNVDVPPRHWVEEALCPEESFCSGEVVPCPDGVRFLGELLFVDEDCSHHVTRPLSQTHSAGERMLVDYIGQTVERVDGPQGEIRRAQALSL